MNTLAPLPPTEYSLGRAYFDKVVDDDDEHDAESETDLLEIAVKGKSDTDAAEFVDGFLDASEEAFMTDLLAVVRDQPREDRPRVINALWAVATGDWS